MQGMLNLIKDKFYRLYTLMVKRAEMCGRQMTTFGIFGAIVYPLFALLNLYFLQPGHYENIALRILAGLLCLFLALKDYWPVSIKWFLPIYWYITLSFALPFFFIFMLLQNNFSHAWLLNFLTVIFFVILVVDWLSAIIVFVIGGLFAWFFYSVVFGYSLAFSNASATYPQFVGTFVVTILLGILFSRNKELMEREKIGIMQETLGASIAHELRTPLGIVSNGIGGIKNYLPDLMAAYKLANQKELKVAYISNASIKRLNNICDIIDHEVNSSFIVIDMLLTSIGTKSINCEKFQKYSIKNCVNSVLKRYPFSAGDRELILVNYNENFDFYGDKLLIMHVLFNLIKNAIYSIKSARKESITIWLSCSDRYNALHFKDTGKGMSAKTRLRIFDKFYTETRHGSGIGLSFCKMVIQSFGGSIVCYSKQGEHTEFILYFPKV